MHYPIPAVDLALSTDDYTALGTLALSVTGAMFFLLGALVMYRLFRRHVRRMYGDGE